MTIEGTVIGVATGAGFVEFTVTDAEHGGLTTYRATIGGVVELVRFSGEVLPKELED